MGKRETKVSFPLSTEGRFTPNLQLIPLDTVVVTLPPSHAHGGRGPFGETRKSPVSFEQSRIPTVQNKKQNKDHTNQTVAYSTVRLNRQEKQK